MNGRIALFVPSLRGGGAERVMLNLAGGFAERGLTVDLIVAEEGGAYTAEIPRGVRLIELGVRRTLASLPRVTAYLRRARPAVLLSALPHANLVALWARDLARVSTRVAITEHNTASVHLPRTRRRRARLLPALMRRFYPRADEIVTVSEGVARDLATILGLPEARIRVVWNPVVTPELLARAGEPLDHPWFAPGEPPVVLAVGRLTVAKDHATLIDAFARLRARRPARLLILGEGEERERLERRVREAGLEADVRLPGFEANPIRYMAAARLLVLSSAWEGLPTVLVEALAVGTPVVSTDCPSGPREILEGGRFGELVPVGDARPLAAAIERALDRPADAERLRERARDFTVPRAVGRYLAGPTFAALRERAS